MFYLPAEQVSFICNAELIQHANKTNNAELIHDANKTNGFNLIKLNFSYFNKKCL